MVGGGGAKVGDRIFVSGTIGDGYLGLRTARGDHSDLADRLREYLVDRYRLPMPRVALGRRLAFLGHAAMDISDGLVADLGHICAASGVGAEIQSALLPMSDAAQIVVARQPALLSQLLGGGDDYELLFTADPADSSKIAAISADVGVPITGIGYIVAGQSVSVTDSYAMNLVLQIAGYRHF